MESLQNTPSPSQVSQALRSCQNARVASLILMQRRNIDAVQVAKFDLSYPAANLAVLAAKVNEAQEKFNSAINEVVNLANEHCNEMTEQFLQSLLGASAPLKLTLPVEGSVFDKTFTVVGLGSLYEQDGEISGLFNVATDDGRSHSQERFYRKNGQLYFTEPDLW